MGQFETRICWDADYNGFYKNLADVLHQSVYNNGWIRRTRVRHVEK